MKTSPATVFARIIRRDPDAVAKVLAENVEALVGSKVSLELVPREGPDFAALFGDRELYVFPIEDHHGNPFPSLMAFDMPAAVYSGGAFSLMGPEQLKEILKTGEVPEILHDSIGEVANIICGAAVHMIRGKVAEAPQFRRGAAFRRVRVGPWPALLAEFGPRVPWEIVACRMSLAGEERGTIFFAASDCEKGKISKEEIVAVAGPGPELESLPGWSDDAPPEDDIPLSAQGDGVPEIPDESAVAPPPAREAAAPAHPAHPAPPPQQQPPPRPAPPAPQAEPDAEGPPMEGLRALVTGNPADPAAAALRSVLESVGLHVLPAFAPGQDQQAPPDAMFVVSRSPVDLKIRLERTPAGRRPGMIVACSDRPTRDLVVAARGGGAEAFLVLPATAERVRSILARLPAPAAV